MEAYPAGLGRLSTPQHGFAQFFSNGTEQNTLKRPPICDGGGSGFEFRFKIPLSPPLNASPRHPCRWPTAHVISGKWEHEQARGVKGVCGRTREASRIDPGCDARRPPRRMGLTTGSTRNILSFVTYLSRHSISTWCLLGAGWPICNVTSVPALACSPPTYAKRVQSPAGSPPGFSHVGVVPDDAAGRRGFLGDLPFPPPSHSGAATSSPHFTLIGSQDLFVKSRLNRSIPAFRSTLIKTLFRTPKLAYVNNGKTTECKGAGNRSTPIKPAGHPGGRRLAGCCNDAGSPVQTLPRVAWRRPARTPAVPPDSLAQLSLSACPSTSRSALSEIGRRSRAGSTFRVSPFHLILSPFLLPPCLTLRMLGRQKLNTAHRLGCLRHEPSAMCRTAAVKLYSSPFHVCLKPKENPRTTSKHIHRTPESEFSSNKYGCGQTVRVRMGKRSPAVACWPLSTITCAPGQNEIYYGRGAAVAEWLDCSPPTKAKRVQNPRPRNSRIFSSGNRSGRCRLSADFLGDLLFLPPLHSDTAPFSLHLILICSRDLVVKSHPNLSTHLVGEFGNVPPGAALGCFGRVVGAESRSASLEPFPSSDAEKRGNDLCPVAPKSSPIRDRMILVPNQDAV
ncbi:hypothetical protein PR048_017005 [Dryococelus australis]|uniref:Uncharacterized protein n=1 Tax=Dryococelus australis TaxID=614101 RepID=A0ABQ9H8C2_9NEOP|nr:hypothetical protein PR048_017005 [Dryococelus australis]